MATYKFGLVSVSFRQHAPEEILSAMQEAELTCIEWGSDVHCPPEKAEEIALLQSRYGIQCCAYGTYFRLGETPLEELPGYIAAAKTLGTDVLRLWCGDKNSQDYRSGEKQALFSACRKAAEIAEQGGVTLCMECHSNTYTNTKEAALALMQTVNSRHFRMYWQPDSYRTEAENMAYAKLLSPYTENIHVFNWKEDKKYPLRQAKDIWQTYLNCFEQGKTLLLEFMPDDKIESLKGEAAALKEIAL